MMWRACTGGVETQFSLPVPRHSGFGIRSQQSALGARIANPDPAFRYVGQIEQIDVVINFCYSLVARSEA